MQSVDTKDMMIKLLDFIDWLEIQEFGFERFVLIIGWFDQYEVLAVDFQIP